MKKAEQPERTTSSFDGLAPTLVIRIVNDILTTRRLGQRLPNNATPVAVILPDGQIVASPDVPLCLTDRDRIHTMFIRDHLTVNDVLRMSRAAADTRRQQTSAQLTQIQAEAESAAARRAQFVSWYARPATMADYAVWLARYIRDGGTPTHIYDHDMPVDRFFVAEHTFDQLPLNEVESICLIVPEGINYRADRALGHNHIFPFDLTLGRGLLFVPTYLDVEQLIHKIPN